MASGVAWRRCATAPTWGRRAPRGSRPAAMPAERVVMSIAATVVPINITGQVVADAWQRIGFNVDFHPLEIAASLQQIASKAPVAQGGWCAFGRRHAGVSANIRH